MLDDEIKKLKDELVDMKRSESDITSWIAKIRQCLSIETLAREMIVELIDSIEISNVYEANGIPQQDINIIYRFENVTDSPCHTSAVPKTKTDGTDETNKEKRVG